MLQEKVARQAETRKIHEQSLRLKMKKQAKELQEELDTDMKILEQLMQETRTEEKQERERQVKCNYFTIP